MKLLFLMKLFWIEFMLDVRNILFGVVILDWIWGYWLYAGLIIKELLLLWDRGLTEILLKLLLFWWWWYCWELWMLNCLLDNDYWLFCCCCCIIPCCCDCILRLLLILRLFNDVLNCNLLTLLLLEFCLSYCFLLPTNPIY